MYCVLTLTRCDQLQNIPPSHAFELVHLLYIMPVADWSLLYNRQSIFGITQTLCNSEIMDHKSVKSPSLSVPLRSIEHTHYWPRQALLSLVEKVQSRIFHWSISCESQGFFVIWLNCSKYKFIFCLYCQNWHIFNVSTWLVRNIFEIHFSFVAICDQIGHHL